MAAMSPYRQNTVPVKHKPSRKERALRFLADFFQFARRELGGHWEQEGFVLKHGILNISWGRWQQVDTCTHPNQDIEDWFDPGKIITHCEDYNEPENTETASPTPQAPSHHADHPSLREAHEQASLSSNRSSGGRVDLERDGEVTRTERPSGHTHSWRRT